MIKLIALLVIFQIGLRNSKPVNEPFPFPANSNYPLILWPPSSLLMELSIYIEMKKSKEYIGRRTENQSVSIEAEDEF